MGWWLGGDTSTDARHIVQALGGGWVWVEMGGGSHRQADTTLTMWVFMELSYLGCWGVNMGWTRFRSFWGRFQAICAELGVCCGQAVCWWGGGAGMAAKTIAGLHGGQSSTDVRAELSKRC